MTQPSKPEPINGALFFAKTTDGKRLGIQLWSESILRDAKLSRSAIRVAWGITFLLDDDAKTWETRANLAKRVSAARDTVKEALAQLRERGHIVTRKEWVTNTKTGHSSVKTVTRPCFSINTGGSFVPFQTLAGGGDSTHPLGGDGTPYGGGDSTHPCNLYDNRDEEPESVETFIKGGHTEEFQDDEDPEEWDGYPP